MSMAKSNFLAPRRCILIFCITHSLSLPASLSPPFSQFLPLSLAALHICRTFRKYFCCCSLPRTTKKPQKKNPKPNETLKKNVATWGMFEIPRKSMQRGTFFLFFLARHLRSTWQGDGGAVAMVAGHLAKSTSTCGEWQTEVVRKDND